ncbi:MAG: transcriptional repressor LexA [Kordiimonadaceae bacterium]|nr:transcriptional repressor LexA [Kordiimonadaceae bacterium]
MLTAKQHQLLQFINQRLTDSGVSPSFDEMKDALGLKSKSGVHRLINALEERGFIRRMANRARALEIVKLPETQGAASGAYIQMASTNTNNAVANNVVEGNFGKAPVAPSASDMVSIPMHGKIAAGTPIEALENSDSMIDIPATMMGRGDCYALEISGDSMIELGIMDGDTVLIESGNTARNGEVVVALVDSQEATLKTLKQNGQNIDLIPANKDHQTQSYQAGRVQIQGRLVGLMRQYH